MHRVAGQVISALVTFERCELKDLEIKVRLREVFNKNSSSQPVLGTSSGTNRLLCNTKIFVVFEEQHVEVTVPSLQLAEKSLHGVHSMQELKTFCT